MAEVGKHGVTLPHINKLSFKVQMGANPGGGGGGGEGGGEGESPSPSKPSPPRLRKSDSRVTIPGPSPPGRRGHLTARRRSTKHVALSDLLESRESMMSLEQHEGEEEEDWIVESPRKIQFERTMLNMKTRLTEPLQVFYEETVLIPERKTAQARSKTNTFLGYLMPRLSKHAGQAGMKIVKHFLGGSTFDDTAVVLPHEVDVFIVIERGKTKLDSLEGGYRTIPLKRFQEKPGQPPDQHRFGRSDSGLFLSSLQTARVLHELVERSLRLDSATTLQPFTCDVGRPQIAVRMRKYTFHITPAICLESEGVHLVTQPYAHDVRPWHELAWRVSHVEKERRLMDAMDKADRGARRKAFKILKAFARVEHTLDGLTSYHVKTVLFHVFDSNVDTALRWQRDPVETAFLELLRRLHHFLTMRTLPHFFINSCDLFENVDARKLSSLQSRVGYLVQNQGELMRVLKKRSE